MKGQSNDYIGKELLHVFPLVDATQRKLQHRQIQEDRSGCSFWQKNMEICGFAFYFGGNY